MKTKRHVPVQPDRVFNPYRCPASDASKAIVADVLNQVQKFEAFKGLRKRARRDRDQATFEQTITALVCDAMHRYCSQTDGRIAISFSNRVLGRADRYTSAVMNKQLPKLVRRLVEPEMAFLELSLGRRDPFDGSKQSTIRCGPKLVRRIAAHGISTHDFVDQAGRETIYLKGHRPESRNVDAPLLDYQDTPTTNQFRGEMNEINSRLVSLNIYVLDEHETVDESDRFLRRVFTRGSFESGGRLFGGFWQQMKKARRADIAINGVGAISLDYSEVGPRIAYGFSGADYPEGGAYNLDDRRASREGIKKVLNAFLFAEAPMTRLPKDTRKYFHPSLTFGEIRGMIERKHAALAPIFFTGIGHQMQFVESQVMVQVLLRLKEAGIGALPVHDAVLVPAHKKDESITIMESAFRDVAGVSGRVSVE